jgi:hypothetical protein
MTYILIALYVFQLNAFALDSLHKNYPDNLLTDNYEILTEADLLYDLKKDGNPEKYDINKMQPGTYRWQCFSSKSVNFSYSTWRDNHPMGASDVIITMCDFSFSVKGQPYSHFYHDRRARDVESCRRLRKDWKRLSVGQSYVCFNGEPGSLHQKEKLWTWNKIKTKKGCVSLFLGDCETKSYLKN